MLAPPQVHSFLLQQQRLRRITSAALVLESAPEAFLLDVQQHLRPLLACLRELGLSQASCWAALGWAGARECVAWLAGHGPLLLSLRSTPPNPRHLQEQTTAVFRGMRRQRAQAARFLALGPEELQRRWYWLCRNLGVEGPPAAAYLASAPSLLLADPADAAAVVRWLASAAGWRRLALRRNLQRSPSLLLTPVAQLEAAATFLQQQLDASVDELCLLLSLAPRLLALQPVQLAEAVAAHPTSWQLAAQWMEHPPLLMREAAVSRGCAAGLGWAVTQPHGIGWGWKAAAALGWAVVGKLLLPRWASSCHPCRLPTLLWFPSARTGRRRCTCRLPRWRSCTATAGAGIRWLSSCETAPPCCTACAWSSKHIELAAAGWVLLAGCQLHTRTSHSHLWGAACACPPTISTNASQPPLC